MKRPSNKRLAILLASTLFALAAPPAGAGTALGPYLIWINLADDASADEAIHLYTHAELSLDSCWDSSGLLVYKEFPTQITPELVRKAFVAHDAAARQRLLTILHRRDKSIESYDGIVVVPKSAKPTLMSLAASGRVKSRVVGEKDGKLDWADAFCGVLPPISRKP